MVCFHVSHQAWSWHIWILRSSWQTLWWYCHVEYEFCFREMLNHCPCLTSQQKSPKENVWLGQGHTGYWWQQKEKSIYTCRSFILSVRISWLFSIFYFLLLKWPELYLLCTIISKALYTYRKLETVTACNPSQKFPSQIFLLYSIVPPLLNKTRFKTFSFMHLG